MRQKAAQDFPFSVPSARQVYRHGEGVSPGSSQVLGTSSGPGEFSVLLPVSFVLCLGFCIF